MSAVRRLAAVPEPDAAYVALEQGIESAETEALLLRWAFGKALVAERAAHGGRQLPHGRLDIVAAAVGRGRRELQHRMRFAELCPTEREAKQKFDEFDDAHSASCASSQTPCAPQLAVAVGQRFGGRGAFT